MRLFFLLFPLFLFSDFLVQQTLMFEVGAVNQIGEILGPAPCFSISGNGGSQTIESCYSIATNQTNKKICGYLDQDMPDGTFFIINMAPPKGARTMGPQSLSATPVDLVIEISKVSETQLSLFYTFESTLQAGYIRNGTRKIFLTLIDG